MSDAGDIGGTVNSTLGNGSADGDDGPAIGLITQYIRDLSAENPNSPHSFNWPNPQVEVQVNVSARGVGGEMHEVLLKLTVEAKHEEGVAYMVDLDYAAIFGIRGLDEDQLHFVLFSEGPRLLFPFARRVLADAVRDLGFPPLVLEPIDFNTLYTQQREAAQQLATGEPAGEA